LTVSIDLRSAKAGFSPLNEVFNTLMVEADDYLYRSKKAGQNRVNAPETPEENVAESSQSSPSM
jgi:PleD family two-component response regulator